MNAVITSIVLAAVTSGILSPLTAQGRTTAPRPTADAVAAAQLRFGKLTERKQKKILEAVRAAITGIDSGPLEAVNSLAIDGAERRALRRIRGPKVGKTSRRLANVDSYRDELPFPVQVEYRFGSGSVEAVSRKRPSRKVRHARLEADLQSLCSGNLLDTDRVLAGLLTQLDSERAADACVVFLDAWPSDKRSIYTALELSAGTSETVFCADAMYSSWVKYCVPKSGSARRDLARGQSRTEAGFHNAFQAIHAYRSLCETIALVAILSPDQRLPERYASRFEDNGRNGNYSTRATIELMLAAFDGDLAALLAHIEKHAVPFPEKPWEGRSAYQPVRGLYAAFEALRPRMHKMADGTDVLLSEFRAKRLALREQMSAAASRALINAVDAS